MAHDREPIRKRRIEVPISSRQPPKQRRADPRRRQPRGNETNSALIDAGIVTLTILLTTLLLLAISGQIHDTTAGNLIAQSPAPLPEKLFTAQPTPQPSLSPSVPMSSPPSSPPSSMVAPIPTPTRSSPTPATETATITPAGTPDDTAIQEAIDRKLQEDSSLSALGITATVSSGKVILVGTVPTDELKDKIEKLVRGIKGVKQINNQIVVVSNV